MRFLFGMKICLLLVSVFAAFASSGCVMAARAAYRSAQPPPPSPLVSALDRNHDGVIDAAEMATASQALQTLDRNGDGKLTRDEYEPKR